MHRTTPRFWNLLGRLPEAVQIVARKNFELLKASPSHPSLHFKKVGDLWSARAGINYRALLSRMAKISFGFGSAATTSTPE
jgi:hypothetical protein